MDHPQPIPDSWEDAEAPAFPDVRPGPQPAPEAKSQEWAAKGKPKKEKGKGKAVKQKSAFSDDEEEGEGGKGGGSKALEDHVARQAHPKKQQELEDDGDFFTFSDDYEDYNEEGRALGDEEDPYFMVPVKKKEFERMFNVKIVNQAESQLDSPQVAAQATEEEAQEYEAPNEPLLLVNWTRLSGGVILKDPTGALGGLSAEQREARDRVLDSILENFETRCEEIFKEDLAYHSDTSIWDRDIQKISKNYPDECWGPLGYPKFTGSYNIKESWAKICKPSKWNSVTAMKKCIGSCSRGIVWKLLLIEEIERLGNEQGKLIEAGLVKLQDPTTRTPAEERKIAEQIHPSNFTPKDMNVLDKIIAMAFERTPVLGDENVHYQTLAKKHFILKKLWFDEFGSLPKLS